MSGYTPVFNTVFDGTLCGKWPDSAVWLTMLALCDKYGEVNLSFAAICARTGWPADLLRQGIESLMSPDYDSQSPAEEGRRLVLIDPTRSWGWKIVNHLKYREKARLQSKDARRTASGDDAERKREERMSPDVPRCPPDSPSSDSDSDSDSNPVKNGRDACGRPARQVPESFEVTEDMRTWAQRECPGVNADAETAKFRDHEFAKPRSDWAKAWRNWLRRSPDFAPRAERRGVKHDPVVWKPTDGELPP